VWAATIAAAGLAVGCGFVGGSAGGVGSAGSAAEGVTAIEVHTQTAQRHVQEALPHSDVTGQVHLGEASVEHKAVLTSATQVQQALTNARAELEQANGHLQDQQHAYAALQNQWYVTWGLRAEKAFWTLATVWLLGSAASLLLGTGTPLAWIAKLRGVITAKSATGWIGNALAK
jgi:hypothetical protein